MRDIYFEFLTLFASIINYVILVFIIINVIGTPSLNIKHLIISAFGLTTSIIVQLIAVILKKY